MVPREKPSSLWTLKNIPVHLHAKLKESAERKRRSHNSEILTRLERDVAAPKIGRGKLARELKVFTNKLPYVDHRIGDRYKRKGLKWIVVDTNVIHYCWVRGQKIMP